MKVKHHFETVLNIQGKRYVRASYAAERLALHSMWRILPPDYTTGLVIEEERRIALRDRGCRRYYKVCVSMGMTP